MGRDLAKRAEEARAAAPATKDLRTQIQAMQHEFQRAMPRGVEATQLVRDALTCLRGTPKLATCSAESVLGGLMTCAQLGLRPGVAGLGHAWLLPMWNGKEKRLDATLIIGYRGYTELAYRHPKVVSIASRVVYSNDRFHIAYNLDGDVLEHEPALDGPRGDPRLYYAIARLDGGYALTEPWSQADMKAHRDRYAMAKTKNGEIVGPWRDHFTEMGRKTMVRNPLAKMIPMSTELALATVVDEGVRVDITPTADPTEVTDHPTLEGEAEPAAIEAVPDPEPAQEQGDKGWPEAKKPGSGE